MEEEWRDIKGFEGYYQVSNQGRVRSLSRLLQHKRYGCMEQKGRILAASKNNEGYRTVALHKENIRFGEKVHRLVASAFLDGEGHVDHINRDRSDNRAENLRYSNKLTNAGNVGVRRSNKSGYKGVSLNYGSWVARIYIGRKEVVLGRFSCPKEAAKAYDTAAIKRYGEFALTNQKLGLID